ncbi:transcription factor, contains a PHD finger motif [Chamberlinius hualienensis]
MSQLDVKPNILGLEPKDVDKIKEEIKTDGAFNKLSISTGANSSAKQQCYCLKERIPNAVELLCGSCCRWFHESCLSFPLGKCVPFMTNYTFLCKECNPSGIELFNKRQSTFIQMCQTTIANLIQQSIINGKPRTMFSKDKEIIPFIDANWEGLTTFTRRVKQTWHTTIFKAMVKDSDTFVIEEKPPISESSSDHPVFGLVMSDVTKIGPNYDHKTGQFKPTEIQKLTSSSAFGSLGTVGSGKGRGAKRKPLESLMANKKIKSELIMPKLPPHGFPLEHPFNKDGYRYFLAEPDPHAPCRQEFDDSLDWAGKPIPGWLYRTLAPSTVLLALHDRAPQLKISEDRLTVTGEKGYCMVRSTHGISHGCWYFECKIEDMPENSATRIGWSQPLGNLQAPLGYDKFGYALRSRKGTRFHESRGKSYCSGYGAGDVLGILINLPSEESRKIGQLPQSFKDRPLVKFKSYLYYEEKDEIQKAVKALKPLAGSQISFYKNGASQGVAWNDINKGTYYPAISLYKNATVSINFGPKFIYPPTAERFRGMHEAAHEFIIEQTISDTIFLVENDGKLRLDTYGT